jgi:uncharacterized membrane protein
MMQPLPNPASRIFESTHYNRLERLARMFDSAPSKWEQISNSFSDSTMTGAFRLLPLDVMGCIVTAMLTHSPHVPPTSNEASIAAISVFNLLCTCRGIATAVSRKHRIEVIARVAFESMVPLPGTAPCRAFTELAMRSVRSTMEARVLFRMLLCQTTHCATTTGNCCRSGRVQLNELLAQGSFDGEAGLQALADACMGEARTKVRISVAATQQASLLCATERGAAISLGQGASRKVVCVTSQPAEVYSPERELEEEFVCEYKLEDTLHQVVHACSEGDLIALLLKNYHQEDCEPQVDVWNMRQNLLVDTRRVAQCTRHIWMNDGILYALEQDALDDFVDDFVTESVTAIAYYRPTSPRGSSDFSGGAIPVGNVKGVESVSLASGTGDLAFIDARRLVSVVHEKLVFVDVKKRERCCFETYRAASIELKAASVVALAPTGRVMVVLGASHANRVVWIYRRFHGVSQNLGWRIFAQKYCTNPRPGPWVTTFGIFSPCGSMVWFFFGNHISGEQLSIDLHAVIKTASIRLQSGPVARDAVPKSAVWGNDGLFLKTGTGWGILRIGTQ